MKSLLWRVLAQAGGSLRALVLVSGLMAGVQSGIGQAAGPNAAALDVVAIKEVMAGDHVVRYLRVRRPVSGLGAIAPAPAPPTPDQEETVALRSAAKDDRLFSLTALVHVPPGRPLLTELTWRTGDGTATRTVCALSTVDFRLLTQVGPIETARTVYSWFMVVVTDETAIATPAVFSPVGGPVATADYTIELADGGPPPPPAELDALDSLHAYYEIHQAALRTAKDRREAEEGNRQRRLREHPPATPDTVIRFWPIQSQANPF